MCPAEESQVSQSLAGSSPLETGLGAEGTLDFPARQLGPFIIQEAQRFERLPHPFRKGIIIPALQDCCQPEWLKVYESFLKDETVLLFQEASSCGREFWEPP